MATLAELRKRAKHMGIAPSAIRGAESVKELQGIIEEFNSDEDDAPAKPRKKSAAVKKSTAKKSSGNSKSASSKSAPAKSRKSGTAKRPAAAKKPKVTHATDGPSGRNMLNGVDYGSTDGWNPRDGSPPDRIVKLLKKFRGNREKVFDALVSDVWDFVGKKMRDGSKRPLKEGTHSAHAMLRYRISRTAWEFAVRTGQHETSEDRVEYGTGGTGMGVFKRRKGNSKSKSASAPARKSATRKNASKATSKAKATSKRGGTKRKSASKRKR